MADDQRPYQERMARASAEIKRINASKADLQECRRRPPPRRKRWLPNGAWADRPTPGGAGDVCVHRRTLRGPSGNTRAMKTG